MKILLLGRNGQLGWQLQRSLAPLGEVIALASQAQDNPNQWCGDLAKPEGLRHTLREIAPDLVVNAAAYTAVDKAQTETEQAYAVNALAPAVLAEETLRLGAWLAHYSTDYVFDGSGTRSWRESDACAPLSVYGASKRQGELEVARNPRHLILRTSWVYAARGSNFAKTMLRLGAERDELRVIDDQMGAPTGAELLADASAIALRQAMAQPALAGLYHCAASGQTSWHGYAQFVFQEARALGIPVRVSQERLVPIKSAEYPVAAPRPLNSRLDCAKIADVFSIHLPSWQLGVRRILQEIALTKNL
ncbi:MAG: dTDP-4-dehydrorhamnose reductase [Rhodoferax sp.]|nr:dTDP-4-dehydrorhamnose reductase [Rhodoferax sp.]